MEFQRGSDIKETMGVGIEANSFILFGMNVMAKIPIKYRDGKKGPDRKSHTNFSTDLVKDALIEFLEMLDSEGLNIKFHDKLMGLMKKSFSRSRKEMMGFNLDEMEIINVTFIYKEKEEDPHRVNDIIPRFFGKFAKYGKKYYEIKDDTRNPGYWND